MDIALPIIRLILIVTFGVAGAAKLRDRAGTASTLMEFGVSKGFAPALAIGLPVGELMIALALALPTTARYGAAVALTLLLIFLAGICYTISQGRRPACNCFGQASSEPIGGATVVRNLLLAGCAILVVRMGPGVGIGEWARTVGGQSWIGGAAIAIGLAVMLLQAGLTLQVLRQQGRLLRRLEGIEARLGVEAVAEPAMAAPGLGVGAPAPAFALENLKSEVVTLGGLLEGGRPLLMLFMNPHCGPCVAMLDEAAEWMTARPAGMEVVVVSEGTVEENLGKSEALNPWATLLQREREMADAYQAWGTPAAVVVSADGMIGSGVAQGADAIRGLVAEMETRAGQVGRAEGFGRLVVNRGDA
jgi:uncharacterized membrane protein YphA (DoxX/SURF4 family)